MSKESTSSGGVGFLGILTLIFITLKLIGKIDWLWCWILAPMWIPVVLLFLFLIAFVLSWILIKVIQEISYRYERRKRRTR